MKLHHLHEDFILPDEEFKRPSPLFITMFMVVVLALTVLLSELIGMAGIGSQSQLMIYILAVLIISCTTPEYLYGIVSALFCSFTFDFLVTAPRMSFSFTIGYPITLITMLLVTFVTSTLTVQIKRQVLAAQDRERRGQLLQEINRKLLGVRDVDSIVHITNEYLVNHLHRPTVFYTRDPGKATEQCFVDTPCQACSTAFFHTEAETKRVHRIFLSGGVDPAAVFDDVEPDVYYVPMASKGKLLGLIGVGCQGIPSITEAAPFSRRFRGRWPWPWSSNISPTSRAAPWLMPKRRRFAAPCSGPSPTTCAPPSPAFWAPAPPSWNKKIWTGKCWRGLRGIFRTMHSG